MCAWGFRVHTVYGVRRVFCFGVLLSVSDSGAPEVASPV